MSESSTQVLLGSIFICYRREDSADLTGRIYDRLVDHFGPERVFIDVEAIRLGYDFRSEIDQTIKVCSIVIVVIGDKWLAEVDGKRRIDDENDRVRIEIEAALRREIPIIPVLTRGASHPSQAMLPASLEDLAYRHGTSIRHEHFRGDMDSLISQMDKLLAHQETTRSKPAKPKDLTTPVKSTQTTQSRPAISPVASISASAVSRERAIWTPKRLVIVTAVGALVILLLAITWSLTRSHPSIGPSELSTPTELKLTPVGDAAAQFSLGVQYEHGQGVPKDLGKAAESYQKAADQGDAKAQNNLGSLYRDGQGVPRDLGKAAELYQKAADQGDVKAQNNLARLYYYGQGVLKDLGKAAEFSQKAANQGNVDAQYDLGLLYQNGQGVPKDLGKAAELSQKAADQGNVGAQTRLGWLYQNGLGVPKDLGKAAELYQKAADQGQAGAQNSLGQLYQKGLGVTKDSGKAAELYQKAADQGNATAQNNLGYLYENGDGVPTDFAKAEQLYQKAADQGNQAAVANLKRLSRH
jgi:TPR repeat protein